MEGENLILKRLLSDLSKQAFNFFAEGFLQLLFLLLLLLLEAEDQDSSVVGKIAR